MCQNLQAFIFTIFTAVGAQKAHIIMLQLWLNSVEHIIEL